MIAAADFTDPENARVIMLAAAGLVALAVLLGIGTVWWWRTSKVEHPALGPLEVMSSRRWAKADGAAQEAQLDQVRVGEEPDERPARASQPPVVDDAVYDPSPSDDEVEVERDLDHYDVAAPALFDQDLLDESGALPAAPPPASSAPAPAAPLDPLLAPRPPQ